MLTIGGGLFYVSSAAAGLVSGVVSWAIQKDLDGTYGYHSWQWLFIVEGIPTIALGLLIVFFLPGFPDQLDRKRVLGFRSPQERELIMERMIASTLISSDPFTRRG